MFPKWTLKKYLIKAIKIIGWIALSIIALLALVSLAIQIPFVQRKIVQEGVSFLKKKIGTEVRLEHVSLSFPKQIVLSGIYLEDKSGDTLLYAGKISINTDLWGLARNRIQLNDVHLEKISAFIVRSARDSTFNFDYIIKAFAADSSSTSDTTQSSWTFTIGNLDVVDTHLSYKDFFDRNDVDLQLGKLEIAVRELDLEQPLVKVQMINLENSRVNIIQSKIQSESPSNIPKENPSKPFEFDIDEIKISAVVADYEHHGTGQIAHLNLGELLLTADNVDLKSQRVQLDQFSLSNTFISYQHATPDHNTKKITRANDTQVPSADVAPWFVTLNDLALSNNSLQYYNFNVPTKKEGVDFDHLWITRLNAQADNLRFQGLNNLQGNLRTLSLQDKSGFGITSFKTSFSVSDTSITVKDFVFQSPQSKVVLQAKSQFSSLATLVDQYPDARLKLDIDRSEISIKDFLYFDPNLLDSLPLTIPGNATVNVNLAANGLVKNLSVTHLSIKAFAETVLTADGSIVGLPDGHALIHLNLRDLYTTRTDVKTMLPDTLFPKNIEFPEWVRLRGKFDGSVIKPRGEAVLTSNMGAIELAGGMVANKKSKQDAYKAEINVKEFQLGKLLRNEDVGQLDMKASIDGSGLTMNDLDARVDMTVFNFQYQQYAYHNFKLNGALKRYFFSGSALLEDDNLNFSLKGDLNYNKDIPEYGFTFDLKNVDFKALHLSERPLKARGTIDVNLSTSDFKIINGNLDIRKVAIYNGDALYAVDSLLFVSIDQEGQSKISIRSDILSGDFEGTINLFSMPEALKRHFNNYFSLRDTSFNKKVEPQNFTFELVLKNTDLLTEVLVPELDPFKPGKIEGAFDSESAKLDIRFDIARIQYGDIGLDSLNYYVTSDKNSIDYAVTLRKIKIDTLQIEAVKLSGQVMHDSIRTKFTILDSLQRDKYVLGGAFYSLEKTFQFHLLSDDVIINYAPWETPRDNSLKFTSQGIVANNFSILNINEKISLLTGQGTDSVASIVFQDLNLQNIANLVEGTILADGLMNGDFNIGGKGAFNSNLKIKELEILDRSWGDLTLMLGRTATGPYNLDLRIEGPNAEIKAAGYYRMDSTESEINFVTNLTRLNLEIIEPLAGGQLKNTEGRLTGEVKIIGKIDKPSITGALAFKDATVTPSFVNSKFFLKDETISFAEEGIRFENFKILDEKNNAATLKGVIKTSSYTDFDFDLDLEAKNFQLLNTTEDENELFYGKVGINTKAKVTGNLAQPKIQMEISLNDESELTYVVPQVEKGVLEQKGIVVFVDKDAKDDPFLASIDPRDTVKSRFTGLELSANIELDDKETLSIVIDPITGDKLSVKGNSTLTLNIDPTGDMQLTGRYEITEGTYDLTFYKLVKRNFAIEKGSTITWAGDPLNATMDIRASFMVETSPMELIANQSLSDEQINMAKQRLPFLVYLNIKGNLLTPEISFELDMPLDKRNAGGGGIYAKIKDINTRESELNKQVFALLILRRFISDNLFETQAGSDVESTARRSVSRLLSEQLNRMSENIKGIELSFDVKSYEDYSTGQAQGQTEVQLGVSKSLLDDRLVVKVSGNVDIEGNASSQSSFADYIGDLALEYKLTEDGRFRITGFRNSNYDIISGELIETGAGLIYIKDYNTLRELFKRNVNAKDKDKDKDK